jgi:hypothetical protein
MLHYSINMVWYDEFGSVFWITLSGAVFAFFGVCLQAILKSRCKKFKCCGIECERDVAPAGKEPHLDLSVLERGRGINPTAPPTPVSPATKL